MAKVLVVDDDHSILRLARNVLDNAGYEAVVTDRPHQVLSLVENEAVDAVVLDVVMPERSGFDVLSDLKARPSTRDVVVLMLSILGKGSDRVRGLRQGAFDYLTKPLEPEELLLKLDRLLPDGKGSANEKPSGSIDQIMQSQHQGANRGGLQIEAEGEEGEIRICDGCLAAARWRDLSDDDAIWAMLNGRFHFRPAAADATPAPASELPLPNLIAGQRKAEDSCPLLRILPAPGIELTPEDMQWLARVQKTIEAGLGDANLSVEALSTRLAIHRSQLYRRLHELTGRSPNQLIVDLRLERAATLLAAGTAAVSSIAKAVGFRNLAHFSHRFKDRFGKPPSAFGREQEDH